jgi:hypothetical protein
VDGQDPRHAHSPETGAARPTCKQSCSPTRRKSWRRTRWGPALQAKARPPDRLPNQQAWVPAVRNRALGKFPQRQPGGSAVPTLHRKPAARRAAVQGAGRRRNARFAQAASARLETPARRPQQACATRPQTRSHPVDSGSVATGHAPFRPVPLGRGHGGAGGVAGR